MPTTIDNTKIPAITLAIFLFVFGLFILNIASPHFYNKSLLYTKTSF